MMIRLILALSFMLLPLGMVSIAQDENPEIVVPDNEIVIDDPSKQLLILPMNMQCTTVHPDEMLHQSYGEIGFLEGTAQIFKPDNTPVEGKFRMFVNPEEPRSYTIMLVLGELNCMVISGSELGPMVSDEGIETNYQPYSTTQYSF